MKSDINRVWTSTFAQAEVAYQRKQGLAKLLLVRNLDVAYDGVQVLFGVNLEVDEGEIVALLGTNGAGKSTLIKAICGLVEATNGAIIFDGRDATYAPPYEVAARGIVQVPGGQGVFPSLTVAENLRLAAWLQRHDHAAAHAATERVLDRFPVLRDRLEEPAANLSGGQQQMLTLGMAFITKPRLLMIDELSLGLAPTIVADLLEVVRDLRDAGHDDHPRRAVGERRAHGRGDRVLHGEGRDPLPRRHRRTARTARRAALGVPRRRGRARPATSSQYTTTRRCYGYPSRRRPRRTPPSRATGATVQPSPTASVEPRLRVESVSKRFGGISALTDVSFEVAPREVVGFIGPNGAGKTTLFDVLCGYQPDDGGEVFLDGVDLTRLAPTRGRAAASAARSRTGACSPRSRSARRSRSRSSAASTCATPCSPR